MLKFFRRIRQKLLEEKKVKQYLVYAAGEVLLILVGILLALQLNQLNENKKTIKAEIQLLGQLVNSLKDDLKDIEANIDLSKKALRSFEFLFEYMEKSLPYSDTLDSYFSSALLHSFFVSNIGPYESIKSQGYEIISNANLRNQVIDLYEGRYHEYRLAEKELLDFIKKFKEDDAKKYFVSYTLFAGMTPLDYEKLKKDQEFMYFMKTCYDIYTVFQSFGNLRSKTEVQNLIDQIETEIEALKD